MQNGINVIIEVLLIFCIFKLSEHMKTMNFSLIVVKDMSKVVLATDVPLPTNVILGIVVTALCRIDRVNYLNRIHFWNHRIQIEASSNFLGLLIRDLFTSSIKHDNDKLKLPLKTINFK